MYVFYVILLKLFCWFIKLPRAGSGFFFMLYFLMFFFLIFDIRLLDLKFYNLFLKFFQSYILDYILINLTQGLLNYHYLPDLKHNTSQLSSLLL